MAEASVIEDVASLPIEGGYSRKIFEINGEIDKSFLCSICSCVYREPMQRECGHRFCKICLEKSDKSASCPNCLEEYNDDDCLPPVSMLNLETNCTPDYFLRKELDRQPAQCIIAGCNWKGKFKDYKTHITNCDWLPRECSQCNMKNIPSCKLEDHKKNECGDIIPCPFECGSQIPKKLLSQHIEQDMLGHLSKLKSLLLNPQEGPASDSLAIVEQRLGKLDKLIGVFQSDLKKFTQLLVNEMKEREALSIKMSKMMPEYYNHNGIYIWRVDDFEKRRQDALSGSCTSIYSLPFYTCPFGYKMCLRLYLNGDGIGKGKYISLFIVVMQGQYDAILSWPFRQKVTLMMLDQIESKHVIDTFRPDSKSSSFQRPEHKMNIASGCPLFFPIERLNSPNNYIKNNTAFFKVIVDTNGLEKMPINTMPT